MNEITESKISLDRIQKFLYAEEVSTSYIFRSRNTHTENAIKIINGNFAWIDEAAQAKANQPKTQGKAGSSTGKADSPTEKGDSSPPLKKPEPEKKPVDLEKGPDGKPPKLIHVLKNLNMEIKKGSFVAILGE